MHETWVWSLGWEDPLEKEMVTHFSILTCEIPWTEEPGELQSMRSQELDMTERLSFSVFTLGFSICVCVCVCLVTQSCPTLCDRMNCSLPGSSVPRDSPGKNTGVGCHALLQGIFPTQRSNLGLLHCRQSLNHLNHHWLYIESILLLSFQFGCSG